MPLHIIVGAQWGDEGKGRIVDVFAAQADITARYNGGDNAGHTVTVGGRIFKLHLVPSGIIHPHVTAALGCGMVVNPARLLEEIETLRQAGIPVTPERLRISPAAHLITPAHQAVDKAQETARGKGQIGTTGRGIGPAYTDKAARRGLRAGDLLRPDFPDRLRAHLLDANQSLSLLAAPALDLEPILAEFTHQASLIMPHIADTAAELAAALAAGKTILAEGAQGTLLDLDHGTYPFVTSSSTTAPAALTGLGLGLTAARDARVSGVVKAFQTRVGSGPFPTELSGEMAARLRGTGDHPWDEFGTTTGRPRRVGWLDGILLRYAARINGLTELVITKLDILSGLETIKVCTAYQAGQYTYPDLPSTFNLEPSTFNPIYEEFPGWREDITAVRTWKKLPANARKYLEFISNLMGLPISLVSVGPEREQIIKLA